MKRIAMLVGLGLLIAPPSWLAAQESSGATHGEVGVYADYLHFTPGGSSTNFVGAGGRAAFRFHWMALEAEMNYDFARNFTTTQTSGSGATVTTTFVKTGVRPLTGLFGPVFYAGSGPLRAFVTGKVGFINFSTTNNSNVVSGTTFTNSVEGVGGAGTHLAVHPGGGLEANFGPFGLRAEVGDELYLNNGTYNNLRVTLGPELRF